MRYRFKIFINNEWAIFDEIFRSVPDIGFKLHCVNLWMCVSGEFLQSQSHNPVMSMHYLFTLLLICYMAVYHEIDNFLYF